MLHHRDFSVAVSWLARNDIGEESFSIAGFPSYLDTTREK